MHDPDKFFYSFYARNCEQMHEATGVLVNAYYELELTYIDTLREATYGEESRHRLSILPVGPLLPEAYFENDPASTDFFQDLCLQWLNMQPESSVLYVSSGSVARLSIVRIQELALGLGATGKCFLLTLRLPFNTENAQVLPEGFEERTKYRGFIQIGWTPQLKVLSHRAVGGFLTHCGWNSTLESICRGVAMLIQSKPSKS